MMRQVLVVPCRSSKICRELPRRSLRLPRVVQNRERLESDMPLMNVLLTLIVAGVLLWLVNTYIPMDAKIKQILNVVAVIAVVLWVLNVFGLFSSLGAIRVGN
jgi:hypothetical protein